LSINLPTPTSDMLDFNCYMLTTDSQSGLRKKERAVFWVAGRTMTVTINSVWTGDNIVGQVVSNLQQSSWKCLLATVFNREA